VESQDALAGVRTSAATDAVVEGERTGSWSLEYAGPDFHVYVRLSRIDDRTRVDGWVVPARPLTVRLLAEGPELHQETAVDEFGRFDFADAPSGLARILFLDESPAADRPRITSPFWI
jgi:hypothetical protein